MNRRVVKLSVNGRVHELLVAPNRLLLEVLREDLNLTGTKFGCELGECGLCTVLIDGSPALSCLTLASLCQDRDITTVEGLRGDEFNIVAKAFAEEGASQCGYCTPSMALMLTHILARGEEVDIRKELSGNICRCTGYTKILKAYERMVELARK